MTNCFKCGETLIEVCPNSLKETKDKLKAIKKWEDRWGHHIINPDMKKELLEILEDKE